MEQLFGCCLCQAQPDPFEHILRRKRRRQSCTGGREMADELRGRERGGNPKEQQFEEEERR